MVMRKVLFFFFQAEDGIRDIGVTGVQTCALPIYLVTRHEVAQIHVEEQVGRQSHALVPHHVEERVARVTLERADPRDRGPESLPRRRGARTEIPWVPSQEGVSSSPPAAPPPV